MALKLWSNDEMLWDQFRDGCDYSFKVIYETHIKSLLLYGRKLNNNRDFVANCAQQLFANLLDRRKHLGPTDNINFYLFKSFRSILIKELRKVSKVNNDLQGDQTPDKEDSIEDKIIYEEYIQQRNKNLHRALDHLSPREKEVLYLKYFTKVSNKEISEILSISYQSVKNTASRAIGKLKEEMMKVA